MPTVTGDDRQVQGKKVNCVGGKAEPISGATMTLE